MSSGNDRLAAILSNKRKEAEAIEGNKAEFRRQALLRNDFRGFRSNLFQPGIVTVIAECKAASPSAGAIVGKYDPVAQAKAIVNELKKYDQKLYNKPRWLVLNKLDMLEGEVRTKTVKDFVKRAKFKGPVFEISALTREGCEPLIRAAFQFIQGVRAAALPPEEVDPRFAPDPTDPPLPAA
jgi:hypothetical protein